MESGYQGYNYASKRKKVLSLVEISTKKCIQHVAKLEDVGATPFRLLLPVLWRMNAKQLAQIEELSPQITPESDEVWAHLVSKEFPDRPVVASGGKTKNNRRAGVVGTSHTLMFSDMPMKSLYHRYSDERESFREDSAQRLRKITERLKKEKSANSIVSVPELLRDPTVRRRRYDGSSSASYGRSEPYGAKNSILNKARKELRNRSLMFPNYAQKVKKYDPYEAFKNRDLPIAEPRQPARIHRHPVQKSPQTSPQRGLHRGPHIGPPQYPPRFDHTKIAKPTTRPRTIFNGQPVQQNIIPSKPMENTSRALYNSASSPRRAVSPAQLSAAEPHSPPTSVSSASPLPGKATEIIRKRRPEPSIFLSGNRNKRPIRVPTSQMKGLAPSPGSTSEPHKKITMIKSSIFH